MYIATLRKPDSVSFSLTGNFTGDVPNLIISKCTHFEIHAILENEIKLITDIDINGRIAYMHLYRPQNRESDWLFISTERHHYFILSWNSETSTVTTEASGDLKERTGCPSAIGHLGSSLANGGCVALHMFQGLLRVLVMPHSQLVESAATPTSRRMSSSSRPKVSGSSVDTFNIRVNELQIISITFVDADFKGMPVLAVLFQDSRELRYVKTYALNLKERELVQGPWEQMPVDPGSNMLIPIAAKHGANDCTQPTTLSYLENDMLFVGAHFGDSQLVKFREDDDENPFEILATFPGLSPMVDFCVTNDESHGQTVLIVDDQGKLVGCCGANKDGSLRAVSSGIGVSEIAELEMHGLHGLYSLQHATQSELDKIVLLSFVAETKVMEITEDGEVQELDGAAFDLDEPTLCGSTVVYDQHVQITANGIVLTDVTGTTRRHQWSPPVGQKITKAAVNKSQILTSIGRSLLVLFDVKESTLVERSRVDMSLDIACLNITPFDDSRFDSDFAVVGMWSDMSVRILELPSLKESKRIELDADSLPRSVLQTSFSGVNYVLVAMGDGYLISFVFDGHDLRDRKKISLGSQPFSLIPFVKDGENHVFAASDRPAIIYGSAKHKIMYASVNMKDVVHVSSFRVASSPNALAFATQEGLKLGVVDDIQKLHVRTIPINESPRRLVHDSRNRCICVLTSHVADDGDEEEASFLRIFDDDSYELLASHRMDANEYASSITIVTLSESKSYIAVGTAIALPTEEEPMRGRILLFEITDQADKRDLAFVAEKTVGGCVYSMVSANGDIIAGVNSKVQVFYINQNEEDNTATLQTGGTHSGYIQALYLTVRGDFILVGDLMKSVTVLQYQQRSKTLLEIAKDYAGAWTTAVEAIDDDLIVASETGYNVFLLRKQSEAAAEEDKRRLELVGQYHTGEFINKIRHGSLSFGSDENKHVVKRLLFCSVNGMIGIICQLDPTLTALLFTLQD
ncbi:DNA damage-binding protein 1a, partial [Blyttiomyces sp. JEL0837]